MPDPARIDPEQIQRHLQAIMRPWSTDETPQPLVLELRVKGDAVASLLFGPKHIARCVEAITKREAIPDGDTTTKPLTAIWVTMNPRDGAGHSDLSWGGGNTTSAKHVVRRYWMVIDVDPIRERDTNSTDAELAQAKAVADDIQIWLAAQGWPAPMRVMSGNGHHLWYGVDLEPETDIIKRVLETLHQRFSNDAAKVDTKLSDAPRVVKVAGTVARKAPHTAERPQRVATLLHVPQTHPLVTTAQLEAVAGERPATPAPWTHTPQQQSGQDGRRYHNADIISRARKYLSVMDPSIQGQQGSDRAYAAATAMVHGFELDPDTALQLLREDFNPRCVPPWSEKELQHKVDDAQNKPHDRPCGWLRGSDSTPMHTTPPPTGQLAGLLADARLREFEMCVLRARLFMPHNLVQPAIEGKLRHYSWSCTEAAAAVMQIPATTRPTRTHLLAKGCPTADADTLTDGVEESVDGVLACVEQLAQHDKARREIQNRTKLAEMLQKGHSASEIMDELRRQEQAKQQAAGAEVQMGSTVLDRLFELTAERHGAKLLQGLDCGLKCLNDMTDGLRGLALFAAKPGIGKSNLLLQMMRGTLRANPDCVVVYFSFEMSPLTLYQRMLSAASGVPFRDVVKGDPDYQPDLGAKLRLWLPEDKARKVMQAQVKLGEVANRMLLHDARQCGPVTQAYLVGVVEAAKRSSGCSQALVLFDSFQSAAFVPPTGQQRGFGSDVERDNHAITVLRAAQAQTECAWVAISEANKAGLDGEEMQSVRGTARLLYQPDFVATLRALPGSVEAALKSATADEYTEDHRAALRLTMLKARDGGRCCDAWLIHEWDMNRVIEAGVSDGSVFTKAMAAIDARKKP